MNKFDSSIFYLKTQRKRAPMMGAETF